VFGQINHARHGGDAGKRQRTSIQAAITGARLREARGAADRETANTGNTLPTGRVDRVQAGGGGHDREGRRFQPGNHSGGDLGNGAGDHLRHHNERAGRRR